MMLEAYHALRIYFYLQRSVGANKNEWGYLKGFDCLEAKIKDMSADENGNL